MNASAVIDRPVTVVEPESTEAPTRLFPDATSAETAHVSFATWLARAVPTTMLLVFVASTVGLSAYRGDFLGAAGLGAFLAAWIGTGVGFLIAGINWGLQFEDSH